MSVRAGLLAGLYEFPTSANVSRSISAARIMAIPQELLSTLLSRPLAPYEVSSTRSKRPGEQSRSDTACRITKVIPVGDVMHVFSHIKKTYRVQWVLMVGGDSPPALETVARVESNVTKNAIKAGKLKTQKPSNLSPISAIWLCFEEVPKANVGTGVTKVWTLVKELWKSES